MGIVHVRNAPFKHDLDAGDLSDALAQIEAAAARRQACLDALVAAKGKLSWLGVSQAKHALLGDEEVKLDAIIRANVKLPPDRRQSLEECFSVAPDLSLYTNDNESVLLWAKPKANGYRPIQSFGPRHRARQLIVKQLLDQSFTPRPFQYTHLGLHSAIKGVKAAINSDFTFISHHDVKQFFGSFRREELLSALPLPPEAVDHVVLSRHNELSWDKRHMGSLKGLPTLPQHTAIGEEALLGIAQGASTSPIVGMICMSQMTWQFPQGEAVLKNYADNLLILAKSPSARSEAEAALKAASKTIAGGAFTLECKGVASALQGFEFLGHQLQIKDGALRVWPNVLAMNELCGELDRLAVRAAQQIHAPAAAGKKAVLDTLARYAAVLAGWRAAFSECDDLPRYLQMFENDLAKWGSKAGLTKSEITAAIGPHMRHRPQLDYL